MEVYGIVAALFVMGFGIGIVAVMAGVGGAVLFVPIAAAFFPFHVDYIRGASLLMALAAALSSSPALLRKGCASLELVMPMALISSIFAIIGARVGLAFDQQMVRILLGFAILFICAVMIFVKRSEECKDGSADYFSKLFGMQGTFIDESCGREIKWYAKNTIIGFILFGMVGFMAGMFGMGAGWANVPVFNLVLGTPLKVAVASSMLVIAISDTAAAWVYLHKGAVLPIVAVPSILGVILGSKVGVKLFAKSRPATIRILVIVLLIAAAVSSLLKGLGVW